MSFKPVSGIKPMPLSIFGDLIVNMSKVFLNISIHPTIMLLCETTRSVDLKWKHMTNGISVLEAEKLVLTNSAVWTMSA